MSPRRLTEEQTSSLKFEDCRACKFVLTRKCRPCDAGEFFEDADVPDDTFEFINRFGN